MKMNKTTNARDANKDTKERKISFIFMSNKKFILCHRKKVSNEYFYLLRMCCPLAITTKSSQSSPTKQQIHAMVLANVCGFQLQTKQNFNSIPSEYGRGGGIVPCNEQTVQNFQMPLNWDVSRFIMVRTDSPHVKTSSSETNIFSDE